MTTMNLKICQMFAIIRPIHPDNRRIHPQENFCRMHPAQSHTMLTDISIRRYVHISIMLFLLFSLAFHIWSLIQVFNFSFGLNCNNVIWPIANLYSVSNQKIILLRYWAIFCFNLILWQFLKVLSIIFCVFF